MAATDAASLADFLVVFGIASIKVSVVVQYWVPIVAPSVAGFLLVAAWLLLLVSRRFFRSYWFEHGIYIFGMSTGVILLRITDPEFRTGVLEDFGLA